MVTKIRFFIHNQDAGWRSWADVPRVGEQVRMMVGTNLMNQQPAVFDVKRVVWEDSGDQGYARVYLVEPEPPL